jgi:hypothetical protein
VRAGGSARRANWTTQQASSAGASPRADEKERYRVCLHRFVDRSLRAGGRLLPGLEIGERGRRNSFEKLMTDYELL